MNKKYLSFRTDMADERVDTYKRVHNLSEVDGIKVTSDNKNGIITTIVEVLNENGEKVKIKGEGLLAQALAHEIDHLDGILFIDKIIPGTLEYVEPKED